MPERVLTCHVEPSHLMIFPMSRVVHPHYTDCCVDVTVKIDTGANRSMIPAEVVREFQRMGDGSRGLGHYGYERFASASDPDVEAKVWVASLVVRGTNGETWLIRTDSNGQHPKLIESSKTNEVLLGMDLLRLAERFEYLSSPPRAVIRLGEDAESAPIIPA